SYNDSNYYIENDLSVSSLNEQPISLSDIDHKNHEYNIETSLDFSSPLPEPEPEPIRSSLKENTETVEMNSKVWGRLKKIITFFKK
ncbi:hypothetical protein OFI99_RS26565, partial [Escherichia coli]|nr:hypothetical protein [Escherichia coli]